MWKKGWVFILACVQDPQVRPTHHLKKLRKNWGQRGENITNMRWKILFRIKICDETICECGMMSSIVCVCVRLCGCCSGSVVCFCISFVPLESAWCATLCPIQCLCLFLCTCVCVVGPLCLCVALPRCAACVPMYVCCVFARHYAPFRAPISQIRARIMHAFRSPAFKFCHIWCGFNGLRTWAANARYFCFMQETCFHPHPDEWVCNHCKSQEHYSR